MKKLVITVLALVLFSGNVQAFQTSNDLVVDQIDTREGGNHSIVLYDVVDENCTNSDRIVIDAASPGAQEMFAIASLALLSDRTIDVAVDGCALIQIGNQYTAPKAIRISIR